MSDGDGLPKGMGEWLRRLPKLWNSKMASDLQASRLPRTGLPNVRIQDFGQCRQLSFDHYTGIAGQISDK